MANEIACSASIQVSKGGASISASGNFTADMAGDQMISNVQIATTSWVALELGSVSTVGEVFFKNMDSTNFVELALDSGGTNIIAKIRAGRVNIIGLPSATIYVRANTASVNLFVAGSEI